MFTMTALNIFKRVGAEALSRMRQPSQIIDNCDVIPNMLVKWIGVYNF